MADLRGAGLGGRIGGQFVELEVFVYFAHFAHTFSRFFRAFRALFFALFRAFLVRTSFSRGFRCQYCTNVFFALRLGLAGKYFAQIPPHFVANLRFESWVKGANVYMW